MASNWATVIKKSLDLALKTLCLFVYSLLADVKLQQRSIFDTGAEVCHTHVHAKMIMVKGLPVKQGGFVCVFVLNYSKHTSCKYVKFK